MYLDNAARFSPKYKTPGGPSPPAILEVSRLAASFKANNPTAPPMFHHPKAHLVVLAANITISTTFPIGQKIAPLLDPVLIVLFRFVLCALLMLPLLLFTNKVKVPNVKRLVQFSVLGGCFGGFFGGFFIMMFTALKYTTALNTSVIYTLVPGLAAVIGFLVLGQRLKPMHFVLLGLGLASTLWVLFQGSFEALLGFEFNPGDLLFAGGCILTAFYSTLLKKFHVVESPFNVAFWTIACGSVLLGIYALIFVQGVDLQAVPTVAYLWVVYLAVMTVFTSFAWSYGTPKLGATHTLAYSYLIPSLVLVINWVILDTLPPLIVLPGVLSGILVMVVLQRKKAD